MYLTLPMQFREPNGQYDQNYKKDMRIGTYKHNYKISIKYFSFIQMQYYF